MKNKELAKYLLENPENEVTISLDPLEIEPDKFIRYFGNILEIMNESNSGRSIILCEGSLNT